jgi:A-macroglobulin receptor
VLALKALVAGSRQPLGGERERRIEITWEGGRRDVVIPADQADVLRQVDLSDVLEAGSRRLTLAETSGAAVGYQVAFRYHVPAGAAEKSEPLGIEIAYDRAELPVGDTLTATATVVNRQAQAAPMVVLDLPIPAGFTLAAEDLARLADAQTIARFQVTPRSAVLYLRDLKAGQVLKVPYRLRATMPVKVTVPAGRVYEYYDTARQGLSSPGRLTVTDRR